MTHPTHAVHHPELLERLRALCTALPEVTEKLSHGSPTWFVRKTFVTWVDDHHGDGNTGFWCAAPPGVQEQMVEAEPERYYRPAYVGHRGWLGLRLDVDRDDDELAQVITEAYRTVAPKSLAALVEG